MTTDQWARAELAWQMPHKSQEFERGPVFTLAGGRALLEYDYETTDGTYAWAAILFERVSGVRFTPHELCTAAQISRYDRLVLIPNSPWPGASRDEPTGPKHYAIYFDEIGCFEIAARSFTVDRDRVVTVVDQVGLFPRRASGR